MAAGQVFGVEVMQTATSGFHRPFSDFPRRAPPDAAGGAAADVAHQFRADLTADPFGVDLLGPLLLGKGGEGAREGGGTGHFSGALPSAELAQAQNTGR